MGKYEDAIIYYEESIKINNKNDKAYMKLAILLKEKYFKFEEAK